MNLLIKMYGVSSDLLSYFNLAVSSINLQRVFTIYKGNEPSGTYCRCKPELSRQLLSLNELPHIIVLLYLVTFFEFVIVFLLFKKIENIFIRVVCSKVPVEISQNCCCIQQFQYAICLNRLNLIMQNLAETHY